jgi:hypothetical protein
LLSGALSVGGERCGSVDAELSEHSCDVRCGGRGCDRSRNKGLGRGRESSKGGEIDDGDRGVDSDRGVDGKLLGVWNGGVGDGSSRVLMSEVIVAVRWHIMKSVGVKELRSVERMRVRRLSDDGGPYMCFCFGVWSFELPHLIFCKDVILIDPHVIRVWVPFPFDQILKSPSSAEPPRV